VELRLGGGRLAREGEGERHLGVLDAELLHQAEADDVLASVRISDLTERVEDDAFGRSSGCGHAVSEV